MDLTNLRLMSEGDKVFEKEMIATALVYLPEVMLVLLNAIKDMDFVGIKSTAHSLKSSFFIIGINDKSILNRLELEKIEDSTTLRNLYFNLENILLASLESLEIEFINL